VTSKVQQTENRHDEAGSEKETRTAGFGQTVLEPFLVFLRLGLTSFGWSDRASWLFSAGICGTPQVAD
jgi:hypothetical protein